MLFWTGEVSGMKAKVCRPNMERTSMTKRDNELTRPELLDKRVKQLLDKWEMHRGQLPQDLITALEGVRKAHEMKWEVVPNPMYSKDSGAVSVVSEPVPAVAPDAPAKPGDLT
jgi:hypothetical protein